jgi:uncharacterized protein (DUF2062 family)
MIAALRRRLPRPEQLARMRGMGWIARLARRRELWRLERRGVAVGLAAGVFFGVLLPVAQAFAAAGACWALRANLPAAMLGTLVSNPLTIAPLYALAYATGALLLGGGPAAADLSIAQAGQRLAAGLAVLAAVGAVAAFVLAVAAWRLVAWRRAVRWSALRQPRPTSHC